MKTIADVCIVPIGVGTSVSKYVVKCEKIFQAAGLNPQLHAYGTNIEGEWDEINAAIRKCHEAIHEMGAPRISTTIRIGTRNDREQSMQDKIDSVKAKMG